MVLSGYSGFFHHGLTGRHDIAELLLKVALSTKKNNHNFQWVKLEHKHTHTHTHCKLHDKKFALIRNKLSLTIAYVLYIMNCTFYDFYFPVSCNTYLEIKSEHTPIENFTITNIILIYNICSFMKVIFRINHVLRHGYLLAVCHSFIRHRHNIWNLHLISQMLLHHPICLD